MTPFATELVAFGDGGSVPHAFQQSRIIGGSLPPPLEFRIVLLFSSSVEVSDRFVVI